MQRRPVQAATKAIPLTLTLTLALTLTLTLDVTYGHADAEQFLAEEEEGRDGCLLDVPCSGEFRVRFDDHELKCGQNTAPDLTSKNPDLKLKIVEERMDGTEVKFDTGGGEKVLVMMMDPDSPSPAQCPQTYWLHWMTFATLQGETVTPTDKLVEYKGPNPPPDTGVHRYQVLVFSIEDLEEDTVQAIAGPKRAYFDLNAFLSSLGLETPMASFQFMAEN
ncbi:hypothetical protein ACOMHN_056394 [Nucella lapillus]